ncbi:MAG: type I methionyl aminopeptidase [Candidatus Dojkabacteria bacterium]|jgi:methionyl aminopeptidase
MIVKNFKEEEILIEAGKISTEILSKLGKMVKAGVTPLQIDEYAGELCREYGVHPAFKRVEDYHFNTTISANDVPVHGIPTKVPFKKGDLVSIDFGIVYKKMYTDHCWTWSIGEPNDRNRKLLNAGRAAVENAVSKAVVGNKTGDLGYEMEMEATRNGFNVLSVFVGHGIGHSLHEEPNIPAFGKRGKGTLLEDGMVICVECQVVDDEDDIIIDDDGWTARTVNGGNSVMFEYMVIVKKNAPLVLTDQYNWDTVV